MKLSPILTIMTKAARKAGRALVRDFGEIENLQVSRKGPADFVSTADKKAESAIYEVLAEARPDYCFLMEEAGAIAGRDTSQRWIIDPLDGTTNFLHGIPLFAVSIALEREGVLSAGVIYNPISDEMFFAEKGIGAYLNDRRLRVSGRRHPADCLVTMGIPHTGRKGINTFAAGLKPLQDRVAGIRRTGAASLDLAWLAAGRFDVYIEQGLSPWDMAAGMVLVREAGGLTTDFNNNHNNLMTGQILAANTTLHQQFLPLSAGFL